MTFNEEIKALENNLRQLQDQRDIVLEREHKIRLTEWIIQLDVQIEHLCKEKNVKRV